jgi:hypothetical protein
MKKVHLGFAIGALKSGCPPDVKTCVESKSLRGTDQHEKTSML